MEKTLETFQPDAAMRSFLQRFIGSSLEGGNPQKKLGFAFGPTNSGKTTTFGSLVYALGDYAATTEVETFAERKDPGHSRNEMARFMGKRLIYAEEISDGLRLSQGMVKRMTGGANLVAKVLYRDTFEFSPEFTVFLAANDYPEVSSTDDPLWDRLVPALFLHTIPAAQRQNEARDHLKADPAALSAVLTWAVEGYSVYQREDLAMPDSVKQAKDAYRTAMNPLHDFIKECCYVDSNARVQPKPLFDTYWDWCKRYKRQPLTQQTFVTHMKALGYSKKKGKEWWWIGISVKRDRDLEPWDWDKDYLEQDRQEGQEADINIDTVNIDFDSLPTRPPRDFIKNANSRN
jgi:putative DNA primase/helicase